MIPGPHIYNPVGCRIQATSHKMQYTSLQDAKDAKDAGYKDAKDTGYRMVANAPQPGGPLKGGRRIFRTEFLVKDKPRRMRRRLAQSLYPVQRTKST